MARAGLSKRLLTLNVWDECARRLPGGVDKTVGSIKSTVANRSEENGSVSNCQSLASLEGIPSPVGVQRQGRTDAITVMATARRFKQEPLID